MSKKYNVLYADPPWSYNKGVYQDNGRKDRNLKEQYPTMTKKEIENLHIREFTDKDCALFLWVTDSHLLDGLELMKKWGFKYKTIAFIWVKKTNKGNLCANVGAWTMKNTEICLLGTRGSMLKYKNKNNIFQLVEAERIKHSQKPEEVRRRIEEIFPYTHKLELFAREATEGWDIWGNEIGNSIEIQKGE